MKERADYKPWQFKPGEGGRPKGAVNKLTRERKERLEWVLNEVEKTLAEEIENLTSLEKVKLWLELQEYVLPKLQRITLDAGLDEDRITKITFEVVKAGDVTEDQLPELLE